MALALPSGIPYWRRSDPALPIAACEVLCEVERIVLDPASIGQQDPGVLLTRYGYVMVMSQDCDLEWDEVSRHSMGGAGTAPATGQARKTWDESQRTSQNKLLDGVLVCVADEEDAVHAASTLHSKQWQFARANQHERYHVLRQCAADQDLQGTGFPSLVLDFKRYFTIPPVELRIRVDQADGQPGKALRRASLVSPFLEDATARFFQYQARVALPDVERPGT